MDDTGPLNILVFATDQHNAHALGCYGNPDVQTPNLDRLAAEGIVFDNAITPSGACRPAKMSMLTGLHARTHGLFDQQEDTPDVAHSLAALCRNAGYKTAFFGKNHMPEKIRKLGFDTVDSGPKPLEELPSQQDMVGRSPLPNEEHSAGVVAGDTISFIEEHADRPFCVFSSHFGPHQPIRPSEPWASQYDPAGISQPPNHQYAANRMPSPLDFATRKWAGIYPEPAITLAAYYGLISQIDFNIGRVLDRLEELALIDRTVIVFLSDHGELMGEHGTWTKEAIGYEAVIRVPFIWRLPGAERGGERRAQLSNTIDMMPTLLDRLGLPPAPEVQGRSLLPVMRDPLHEGPAFEVSEVFGAHHGKFCSALRTEKWKYFRIVSATDPTEEFLFDLENDPWEMRDLSTEADCRASLDQCREQLDRWQRETGMCGRTRKRLVAAGLEDAELSS
ncbi:MAG: sulfatase [Parasphingopyxis sp.]|nr:sulfatase-like hydrolase/transferase [Sphingomonadales bacterium]